VWAAASPEAIGAASTPKIERDIVVDATRSGVWPRCDQEQDRASAPD
jgi:hypothetical protein